MTRSEEIYASTLNLLGSDVQEPEIQDMVDREHAAASPDFSAVLKSRTHQD